MGIQEYEVVMHLENERKYWIIYVGEAASPLRTGSMIGRGRHLC